MDTLTWIRCPDERHALMTGAVPGIIDDDWREPFHPRTARVLEMGGGHGSGGDANAIPVAVVVADDDPPGDRADDVPVAAVASPAPSPKKAPPPNSGASPCPEVAELAHLRRLVAKGVPLTVARLARIIVNYAGNGPRQRVALISIQVSVSKMADVAHRRFAPSALCHA